MKFPYFPPMIPWNQDALLSWHIDVFTNQEAHLNFPVQIFIVVSLCRYVWLNYELNLQLSIPLPRYQVGLT